ncbi:MAG: hypothetical protein M0036_19425 [Desulfobacteraceae bacterium]|nr:hypothetical protein [Desulfobacteraceae bacterium]
MEAHKSLIQSDVQVVGGFLGAPCAHQGIGPAKGLFAKCQIVIRLVIGSYTAIIDAAHHHRPLMVGHLIKDFQTAHDLIEDHGGSPCASDMAGMGQDKPQQMGQFNQHYSPRIARGGFNCRFSHRCRRSGRGIHFQSRIELSCLIRYASPDAIVKPTEQAATKSFLLYFEMACNRAARYF